MGMAEVEILGIIAACLVNVSFFPQILKTVRTKRVGGISLPFWVMLFVGSFLWGVYGILVRGIALVLSSVMACGLCLTMIALVLKYRTSRRA